MASLWNNEVKLAVLRLLQKEGIQIGTGYPRFESYEDESGEIILDSIRLINYEDLKKLIDFCEEQGLKFQIFTQDVDGRVETNKIRICICPKSKG